MIQTKKEIVLASQSPRRKELLGMLGVEFTSKVRSIDEVFPDSIDRKEVAEYLAKLKLEAFKADVSNNEVVITSDTVVLLGDQILGKPKNRTEAIEMIQNLSGREHLVISGVAILNGEDQSIHSFSDTTIVRFTDLTKSEIEHYVDEYKPFDKAGSYGIQEWIGMVGIENLNGCYYNVMGLPVRKLYKKLQEIL